MTWFKVDDKSHSHAKVIAVGNAAWGLFCRLGAWSSDQLTDGYIPVQVARSMGSAKELRALTEPVPGVGSLMEHAEGGYQIPNFLEFNRSRVDVEAERDAARERMRKRRGGSENVRANIDRSSEDVREPRPVPSQTGTTTSSSNSRRLTDDDDETPVDNYEAVADHLAALKTEQAHPRSPKSYRRTVRANIDEDDGERITELIQAFPDAPVSSLAAAVLTGDTRQLAGWRRETT